MKTTSPLPEAPDELDRLFSEFFKAQLKQPWPNAPVPAAGSAAKPIEPSELVAGRAASAPRNAAPVRRDNIARARFTLAAGVALMLGTCWYLSNGFDPGSRPGGPPTQGGGPGMLPGSGADGDKHLPLQKLEEDKAKGNMGGMKMDMDKFE